jgi:hypothetical protein
MKVTNAVVLFGGVATLTDSHGNNVAWCCPSCGHPVLFVCRDNQQGFNEKYTDCKGCSRKYTIIPEENGLLKIKLKQ